MILEQLPTTAIRARVAGSDDFVWVLVDGDYDGEYFAQFPWFYNSKTKQIRRETYNNRKYNGGDKYQAQKFSVLAQEVARAPKGMWVRHINGDPLDNRSANLEVVSPKKMMTYRRPQTFRVKRRNKSGYRGVRRYDDRYRLNKPWGASCGQAWLGFYHTAEEAAQAYDRAALARWGERAYEVLNFPKENYEN